MVLASFRKLTRTLEKPRNHPPAGNSLHQKLGHSDLDPKFFEFSEIFHTHGSSQKIFPDYQLGTELQWTVGDSGTF